MKIGGENINFTDLEIVWESIRIKYRCPHEAVLIDMPDERLGKKICLAVVDPEKNYDFTPLVEEFRAKVIPIARLEKCII